MNLYKKCGKVEVEGVNKVVYSKTGTKKKYVVYKKRHISLTKYKKIKANNKKEKHSNKRNNKSGGLGTNFFRRNNNKTPFNFHPEGDSSSRFRLPSISMNPAKWFSTPTKKPKDSHLNSANPDATTTRDDARKQIQQEKLLSTYEINFNHTSQSLRIRIMNNQNIIWQDNHDSYYVYHIINPSPNTQILKEILQKITLRAILQGRITYLKTVNDYNTRINYAVNKVKNQIFISLDTDKSSDLLSLNINENGDYAGYTNRDDVKLTNNLKEYFMKEFPPPSRGGRKSKKSKK
jgi:hypothetical protein